MRINKLFEKIFSVSVVLGIVLPLFTPIISTINDSYASGADPVYLSVSDYGDYISVEASRDFGSILIESLQYRIDEGTWVEMQPIYSDYGTEYVYSEFSYDLLSPGSHLVDFRVIDDNTDIWPQPDGYYRLEDVLGPEIVLEVYEDFDLIDVNAYVQGPEGSYEITTIEYSINNGSTWQEIPNLTLYSDSAYGTIYSDIFPPASTQDIYIRALDSSDGIWPQSGPYIVNSFQGLDDQLIIDLYIEDYYEPHFITADVYSDQGILEIGSFQYRLNGGEWIDIDIEYPDYSTFELYAANIPSGNQFIEFRAIDNEYGIEWPQGGYESANIDFGIGSSSKTYLYEETFNDGIGTILDYDNSFDTSIGYEWYANFNFSPGRIRIQDGQFSASGNDGALTIDNTSPATAPTELYANINIDESGYYSLSDHLYLEFDYIWHDSFISTQEATQQNENKVYIDAGNGQGFVEVYDLYSNGIVGNYQTVLIDLDQPFEYLDSYIELKFTGYFDEETLSINGSEGYSIDNLRIYHKLPEPTGGGEVDTTPPEISFDGELQNVDNNHVTFSGTGFDDTSNITSITVSYYNNLGNDSGLIYANPSDGNFNSISEDFYINIFDLETDTYTFTIRIENTEGLYTEYVQEIEIDDTPPEIIFTETPNSISNNRVYIRGEAFDNLANIFEVELDFFKDGVYLDTFEASPDDGNFDSISEDFTFNIYPLSQGNYEFNVRARSIIGMASQTYSFSTSVDVIQPTFEVSNFGQAETQDTTPEYTGFVTDNIEVSKVEYSVYTLANEFFPSNMTEVDWTEITADDGAFDSDYETFTFSTLPLLDGDKSIVIRAYDSAGNISDGGGGYVVDTIKINAQDTSSPIIEIQPVLPNPTIDTSPVITGKVADDNNDLTSNIVGIEYNLNNSGWIAIEPADGTYDEKVEEFTFELSNLEPDNYTLEMRAVDNDGNDTESQNKNISINFEVINVTDIPNSVKVQKTSDFITHQDHDLIASEDTIWGRNRLRLRQYVSVESQTPLYTSNSEFGPRYGFFFDYGGVHESQCDGGGYWISKVGGEFSFLHSLTSIEYDFDVTDYAVTVSDISIGIKEYITPSGECHVWIESPNGLTAINFGSSIVDGSGDTHTHYDLTSLVNPLPGGSPQIGLLEFDTRDPENYGVYYAYPDGSTGGVNYIKPGIIGTQSDDQIISYQNTLDYSINVVTKIKLITEGGRNQLWLADYHNGITVIDDNNTPLNLADDTSTTYPNTQFMFDIGIDKNGNVFFAGNFGVGVIYHDNNTFDASDDQIEYIVTPSDLSAEAASLVRYLPGDDIIGEQYFVGTRSGQILYHGTNDTITDPLDDESYLLDVTNNLYPTSLNSLIVKDEDTLVAMLDRQGIYTINLNREFAEEGIAVTKVYSSLEGNYLDLDFIKLVDIDFIDTSGSYEYLVSNDGGFTWKGIEEGETVNFEENGYQLVFGIRLFKGSTPIVSSFELEYSAYPDEDYRGFNLDITDEPNTAYVGDPFQFSVVAIDDLSNPIAGIVPADIELRRVIDNEIVEFNVDSVSINEGIVTIDSATVNMTGDYYIVARNTTVEAISNPITFLDKPTNNIPPTQVNIIPELNFRSDKYIIDSGEEITLSWTSKNFDKLYLTSDKMDYGEVNLNSTLSLTLEEDTVFTLQGKGPYGNLESEIKIIVKVEENSVEVSDQLPAIERLDIEVIEEKEKYNTILVSWKVLNVEKISITNIGENLPPEGSIEINIEELTEFQITAKNDFGEVEESTSYKPTFKNQNNINTTISSLPVIISSITALLVSMIAGPLNGGLSRLGILFGIIIPRKKKYWGITFDINSNKPVPFAVVRILEDGKEVASTVSDEEGRYGVIIEKEGEYEIRVNQAGFKPYSKSIKLNKIGENIEIVEDIPLTKVDEEVSLFNKIRYYGKLELIKYTKLTLMILMIGGFIYSAIITIQYPTVLNFIILGIYFVLFMLQIISFIPFLNGKSGRVIDADSKKGVAGASIRLYDDAKQIGVFLTNTDGKFKINIEPGDYWFIVYKDGYESYSAMINKDGISKEMKIRIDKRGFLSRDIEINKAKIKKGSLKDIQNNLFANPFSK